MHDKKKEENPGIYRTVPQLPMPELISKIYGAQYRQVEGKTHQPQLTQHPQNNDQQNQPAQH